MTEFSAENLQKDAFLGGKLHLWQPVKGYRAGVDPVLLAASVPAKPGQTVLDLGCGAGAAALCLGVRVAQLQLYGVEREPAYAALARRNGLEAAQDFTVTQADLAQMPAPLRAMSFDHVISNPPYYDRAHGTAAPDRVREAALGEDLPLAEWIGIGARRVKPRGYLHLILKADRLADALSAMNSCLGSLEVLPLAPRVDRAAELVLMRGRKEGRAPLKLHAPLILHRGADHPGDKDHYTKVVSDVLRCGAPITY
ncbi:methyltransferase domain-containing protein [Aliishimia ponticola]|uniref:Methyltransferase domain-containing protein n=1 Tax=Aliishimia ponticola TaxID=2499833 RepID=A0A4S4NDY1_9RHOB|nr:methyltransferase [Aliishimia ponticola]THH36955.1 methyltransferase domain-containing protein [Aliishimia ponticola]